MMWNFCWNWHSLTEILFSWERGMYICVKCCREIWNSWHNLFHKHMPSTFLRVKASHPRSQLRQKKKSSVIQHYRHPTSPGCFKWASGRCYRGPLCETLIQMNQRSQSLWCRPDVDFPVLSVGRLVNQFEYPTLIAFQLNLISCRTMAKASKKKIQNVQNIWLQSVAVHIRGKTNYGMPFARVISPLAMVGKMIVDDRLKWT